MSLVDPSASPIICLPRSMQTSVTSAVSSASGSATPEAPEASSSTVSLVDRQPSESIRWKVTRVASLTARCRVAASATASVVMTTSMVARDGASIAAPLAMPPTTTAPSALVRTACLLTVSVVRIASAAAGPPSAESCAIVRVTPPSSRSIGSRTPISPVEQTATSPAPIPSPPATCSAVTWVSAKPSGPVQAFAPPELRTTARSRPSATAWRVHWTGAACTRLVVNTAAAASDGPSLTTSATSGRPDGFRPAATPAARKPFGAVTLTCVPHFLRELISGGRTARPAGDATGPGLDGPGHRDRCRSGREAGERQAHGLGQAEHQVRALNRLAGGALGEVVDRRDDDDPAGVLVVGRLQVDSVAAERRRGARPAAGGQHRHERLVVVAGAQDAGDGVLP